MLEEVADNQFNSDPYCQQGGDMIRCRSFHTSVLVELSDMALGI